MQRTCGRRARRRLSRRASDQIKYLGYIASQTYQRHGFFASSLVVSKEEFRPSASFFKWMRGLGVAPSSHDDDDETAWKSCYAPAIEWYRHHPGASAL